MDRATFSLVLKEGIAAKRAWLNRPTAAKGSFPYKHKTVAQVDAGDMRCPKCKEARSHPCSYSRCPLA